MHNFTTTLFSGMRQAGRRVLLRWSADDGTVVDWRADELLRLVAGFQRQLGAPAAVAHKAFIPLQALSAPRFMALLALMGFGASLLLPPAGQWRKVLRAWYRRSDFGGVMLVDESPLVLRVALRLFGVRVLRLRSQPVDEVPTSANVAAAQPALVSYSSGSTGEAKVLERGHDLLKAQHRCLRASFPPFAGQVDSSAFPNVLLHQLACGTTSFVPAGLSGGVTGLDYPRLAVALRQNRVNTLTGNPHFLTRLLDAAPGGFPDVQACGIGGAPVDEGSLARLRTGFPNADLYVIYGATEAEPIALRRYAGPDDPRRGYAVGTPVDCLAGLEIRDARPLPVGGQLVDVGEIFVAGAHVLTSGRGHGTGDFGYLLDGRLYLTARAGNTEPCHGHQHYPLEHVLRLRPGVDRVAVLTRAERVDVYYVGSADEHEVRSHLRADFPALDAVAVHRRRVLPLDGRHHSKILYHRLRHGN